VDESVEAVMMKMMEVVVGDDKENDDEENCNFKLNHL
jgi:hypothetical protein